MRDLAVLFGYKGDNEDLQLQCLLNQCEVNPKALIDAEQAVDTEAKVLLTELIDKEISDIIEEQYQRAIKLLEENKDKIEQERKRDPNYLKAKAQKDDINEMLDYAESKVFEISEMRMQKGFAGIKKILHKTIQSYYFFISSGLINI